MVDELPHVEVMRLEPGDVIVLTFAGSPGREAIRRSLVTMQERFPGHEVIAVGGGVTLSVARSE